MRETLEELFLKTMQDFRPETLVRGSLKFDGKNIRIRDQVFHLSDFSEVFLIATGKASEEMAVAVKEVLGDKVAKGLVISAYETDHTIPGFTFLEASHPVPDEKSLQAGQGFIKFIQEIPAGSLVINGLSGGTSSLLTLPAEGITIDQLNRTYEYLNNSGATIREINTVRKHLSMLKGGQVLRYLDPSVTLVDLVISDVPGDDLEIIGSGPTTPDSSTFQDAYHVLLKYELWKELPSPVRTHIEDGLEGIAPETVKPGEDPVKNHYQYIIGSPGGVAKRASELLEEEGYKVHLADKAYNEDVRQVAERIAAGVQSVLSDNKNPPGAEALVFYGESTVDVRGDGKGGRNQELALWGALKIEDFENITWLSAGTDGIDGPTDAAGAIVTNETASKAREKELDPHTFLNNNDAYHFHEQMGTLLKTGPTGNNLMDLQIVLVEKE